MTDAVDLLVIVAMALATYACRTLGFFAMRFVTVTRRVRAGFEALPGAVVVSIVLPAAFTAGPPGVLGIVVGIATMALVRKDVVALFAGCAAVAAARAAGM